MKTIIFFVGESGVGKTHLLRLLDVHDIGEASYVNDSLVVFDNFEEQDIDSVPKAIAKIYKEEKYLSKDATFIFVLNYTPKYDYSKILSDCRIKVLTLEDKYNPSNPKDILAKDTREYLKNHTTGFITFVETYARNFHKGGTYFYTYDPQADEIDIDGVVDFELDVFLSEAKFTIRKK